MNLFIGGPIVSKTDWQIELLPYGEIVADRINFSIDENKFLIVFTPLDTINDESTLTQKAKDFGFTIPYNSFDVKFDRTENFESDNYYDSSNSKMNLSQLNRLGEEIKQIMIFHYSIKNTEVYFATTERIKLTSYYDRLVRKYANQCNFEVIKIKEEGFDYADYAFKTPKFKGK